MKNGAGYTGCGVMGAQREQNRAMNAQNPQRFGFSRFRLDGHRRSLVDADGNAVSLTPRAFDALLFFLEHPGRVIGRREMIDALWPNTIVEENNLSQIVAVLRRTLGDDLIVTVPRRGYQFVAEVRSLSGDDRRPRVAPAAEIERRAPPVEPADRRPSTEPSIPDRPPQAAGNWKLPLLWTSALVVLTLGLVVMRGDLTDRAPPLVPKVAVLPCENIGPDAEDAYISAGMHEEIINRLAQLSGLLVVSRTSVLQYEHNRPPMPQIARELDVTAVMECSVRHAGTGIVVTAQLIDPRTDAHLWSHSYPGEMGDLDGLFEMQAAIALDIAGALDAKLTRAEQDELRGSSTDSPEAYVAYLRALELDGDLESERVIGLLDAAIELDPGFARAYAIRGITRLARVRSTFAEPNAAYDVREEIQLAWADADNALALDSRLGLAHFIQATRYVYPKLDVASADAAVARALELSPNDGFLLYLAAGSYLGRLRVDEARTLLERSGRINPNFFWLGWMLWLSGDLDGALAQNRQYLTWNPTDSAARQARAFLEALRGNTAEAIRQIRIADDLRASQGIDPRSPFEVYTYGRLGLVDEAKRAFEKVRRHAASQAPIDWVYHYLGIGDVSHALEWARRVAERPLPPWANTEHAFVLNSTRDPVLERPEFLELRAKLAAGRLD